MQKITIPVRLSILYFFFGTLWIIFSGSAAEYLSRGDAHLLKEIERYKGIFFIIVSTLLLFAVSRSMYKSMSRMLDEHKLLLKKNDAISIASKEGMYEYEIATDKVILNAALCKTFGITNPIQFKARKFWEMGIHPEDKERVLDHFDSAQKAGIDHSRAEYRFKTIKGDYKSILHSLYIVKDKNNKPNSVIGAIQDLTEFRKLQSEYYEQQIKMKTDISAAIIQTEEKERNRWAEELHDNISQVLSVAKLYAGTLTNPGISLPETAKKIQEMITTSIQEIRLLSANLKPPQFQDHDMKESIDMLVYSIKGVKDIRFAVDIDKKGESNMDNDQKLMVYRIIQEQLNNSIKYAEAKNISIQFKTEATKGVIRIKDDGNGFDTNEFKSGTGFKNIRSRLSLFKGNMELVSQPGNGCELKATFSLVN